MNEAESQISEHAVIGRGVVLGKGVVVGPFAVIHDGSVLGDRVRVHEHAVIGKLPMRAANSAVTVTGAPLAPAVLEEGCVIGTGAVVYRGAYLEKQTFVADLATIRERVHVGEATIVGRGVAVENDCRIGERCKLETGSYICAFSELDDFVFIAPGVVTTNDNYMARSKARFGKFKGVTVKRGGRIGAGATVLPGVTVHEDGAVAAGSVVTRDVPSRTIVAGVPARPFREVPREQWLEHQ